MEIQPPSPCNSDGPGQGKPKKTRGRPRYSARIHGNHDDESRKEEAAWQHIVAASADAEVDKTSVSNSPILIEEGPACLSQMQAADSDERVAEDVASAAPEIAKPPDNNENIDESEGPGKDDNRIDEIEVAQDPTDHQEKDLIEKVREHKKHHQNALDHVKRLAKQEPSDKPIKLTQEHLNEARMSSQKMLAMAEEHLRVAKEQLTEYRQRKIDAKQKFAAKQQQEAEELAKKKAWRPPAHLPPVLFPNGSAENALKAGAQKKQVDQCLLKKLHEGIDRIRRHPALNSPPATDSPEAMRAQYETVLHQDIADCFLRFCLARHAGFDVAEDWKKNALEVFKRLPNEYEALIGDLFPPALRDRIEEERYAAEGNSTAAGDWGAFMRRLKAGKSHAQPGLLTGFKTFDDATGGLRGVTLLAGLTGSGKTTLGLNFALGVLRQYQDVGVVVFNLESSRDKYFVKLLSDEASIDYRMVSNPLWPKELEGELQEAQARLAAEILPRLRVVERLEDTRKGSQTHYQMTEKIVGLFEEANVEKVLIVVDRIQKLEVMDCVDARDENDDVQRVRPPTDLEADDKRMTLLSELHQWSQGFTRGGFPVLAISRVNKTDQGRRLTLADVPGRAELVFEADSVLLLEPKQSMPSSATVTPTFLNIAKVRDGGLKGDIHLDFHHTVSQFKESAGPKQPDGPTKHRPQDAGKRQPKRFSGKK